MTWHPGIPAEYRDAIVTGDARELAKRLPDESVDMVLTSPPYDDLRTYNGYTFDFEAIAGQLARVLKPGGVIVWVVDDQKLNGTESGTSMRQALYFMSLGLNLHDKMIYESINGAMGAPNEYLQCFEMMFVFSKGTPKAANLIRDRRNVRSGPELKQPSKRNRDGTMPTDRLVVMLTEYGRRKNIWRYAVGGHKGNTAHPGTFPDDLAKDHILSWTNGDDVVLDPMCGSGTACKMARTLGRHWIGFEISDEYAADARLRVERTQPPLFVVQPAEFTS